jgi:hypothetical protein
MSQAARARVGETWGPEGESEARVESTSVVPVNRDVAVAAVAMESKAARISMLDCKRSSIAGAADESSWAFSLVRGAEDPESVLFAMSGVEEWSREIERRSEERR